MEIISRIHRISTQTAKPLHLYVLKGPHRTILLDSGTAQTPDEVILPYFAKEGIDAEGPLDVIVTHADCDHCGGDGEMKRLCPQCQIHVSTQDRVMVEDPRRLMSHRYEAYEREHGLAYDEATKNWLSEAAGRAQEIDSTLAPGQRIRLSEAWDVEILPLPGHTLGHIMIWDPRHRIAFIGDGVLGHGEYDLEGRLFAPPTYVTARGYLESIDRLESLNPEIVLRGHRDPIAGEEVPTFLTESREWAQAAEAAVEKVVRAHAGTSLSDIIEEIGDRGDLGTFVMQIDLMYPFAAHLQELKRTGKVRSVIRNGLARYYWS